MSDTRKIISKQDARAGRTTGRVRAILFVSTVLAVVCLAVVVVSFAG